ncbi:uncharacterized protein LOC129771807 [Toxorhynchites rutilus septentrionalis]|uniref:uncharacterized protein LOC129771807 n=1 Tax=Toxorhynchites rutilus septentrionalis TaxID=329112 RepID=UPI0024787B3F|nr:uncharacterized protein LOC129771807 [Toxorhynchites rutilus septentrionalis]
MAQGKLKLKKKDPVNNKKGANKKGEAFSRRKRAPIQSKKHKFQESLKLQQAVSRTLNQKNEDDIRKLVYEGQKNLSQAQQAVSEHHKKKTNETQQAGSSASSK